MLVTIQHAPSDMRVRFDPHDNSCHGLHDIILIVMPIGGENKVHVTTAWKNSALLSIRGSREFAATLNLALDTADAMAKAESIAQADLIAKQYLRSFGVAIDRE